MQNVSLLINGSCKDSKKGAFFERHNPLDGSIATVAAAASDEDAKAAVQAAAEAFPAWSQTAPNERREILTQAAHNMETSKADFIDTVVSETGGTASWAEFNVHLAVEIMREAAAITTQISGEVVPADLPGSLSLAMRVPTGVVVGMAPWNAPIVLGARAIATPLACGNTVVLRGSEICPATHALIAHAVQKTGAPDGTINYITNDPKDAPAVVEALIAHPATRRVNFTGSTRVGRLIAGMCAQHLTPAILELGGKAPLVVLDDADMDCAVNAAAFGAFANSGQICMSTERIIVDERIADEFIERLVTKVRGLPAGDPRQGRVILGSLVSMSAADRCNEMITDALNKGASLLCGGRSDGTILPATLLDHVTPQMRVYHEEVFGPVRGIIRVDGDDAALACANDTAYGLSAAVISTNIERAMRVARGIQSGICHINSATVYDEPQMPFGGLKDSGYGRFGGKAGIEAFTDTRWLNIQTRARAYPF